MWTKKDKTPHILIYNADEYIHYIGNMVVTYFSTKKLYACVIIVYGSHEC